MSGFQAAEAMAKWIGYIFETSAVEDKQPF